MKEKLIRVFRIIIVVIVCLLLFYLCGRISYDGVERDPFKGVEKVFD